ncbi:hypothetical protein ARALYDRAFT_920484 [Arabidopsis lyrata subsp. lyrata]|uniref:Uncharacterized protein n=1 Tax=Arabidopsis lyrata subsp. lyrata TaxID=81972 RepID=D7MX61_ARALL|nr:hypothetical protein ARALYDRAFT_920484 [Arabidopsis lyrata subsp. lyrata]
MALAVDLLFFYTLSIGRTTGPTCLHMDGAFAAVVTCGFNSHVASIYVSRDSLVVGCGKLVWDPRAIASYYARFHPPCLSSDFSKQPSNYYNIMKITLNVLLVSRKPP